MTPFAELVQEISAYFNKRETMRIPDAVNEHRRIADRIMAAWVRGDISATGKETLLEILREGKEDGESFKC